MFRRAFTLMEVNLAILVMAGGLLSIIGLYSFGYREAGQSGEDVASAAYADAVIGQLAMAISQTNVKWSVFRDAVSPSCSDNANSAWRYYCDGNGEVTSDPEAKAIAEFNYWKSKLGWGGSWPSEASGGLRAALVVQHDVDDAIVRIGFRATKKPRLLLSQPLYYTEVRFQGVPE